MFDPLKARLPSATPDGCAYAGRIGQQSAARDSAEACEDRHSAGARKFNRIATRLVAEKSVGLAAVRAEAQPGAAGRWKERVAPRPAAGYTCCSHDGISRYCQFAKAVSLIGPGLFAIAQMGGAFVCLVAHLQTDKNRK